MESKVLTPRKALNKAFLKLKPSRIEIEDFKTNLVQLLDRTNVTESEEFHKNLVIDFLKKTYYDPNHFINTKGRNDLVIHNGQQANTTVGVIIETKRPTNRAEMISTEKLNVKAFQELVLYYLRERITHKNLEIKHLIVTNINEWFIFDVTLFERLFAQNKKLVTQFNDFENGRLADTRTDFFYKHIAEPFIADIATEVEFTYFNIQDYQKPLRNADKEDDNQLIALFKLLSPEHLLKLPFANDSNSLDKGFYNELLHVIGLTEIKDGSKKVIERNKIGERHSGTILEDAIIQLDSLDKLNRLDKPSQFGSTKEAQLFNVALELSITWINRILFLKLLEAQLITYHKGDEAYSFLNLNKLKTYDDVNSLFFQVLARDYGHRNDYVKKAFEKVPFLNSSLFEPTEMEQRTLVISNLQDNKTIPIFSQTVLKDLHGKKRTGNLNTLEYLFEFLNAYDFGGEGSEDIQEENKTLINASVLGLIFEKINGYKDGSFFTPGFVTMYMCRETIRKAVLTKFKQDFPSYKIDSIEEVYALIPQKISKKQANIVVNSLKICDPAVGSGHFLVSALNELIAIKNYLKIIEDKDGKSLHRYEIEVVNDELVVTDEAGGLFEYNPNNKESQRIQATLFHEKQIIIENCLFGVDINSNSVKICRLRLWIELLKNAYYKTPTELETLPNIDINIKCGNSLINRFPIDADLKQALKKSKWSIDSYKLAVSTYRNAENKEQKREMELLIANIKSDFRNEIETPFKKKLSEARGKSENLSVKILNLKAFGEKPDKKLLDDHKKAVEVLLQLEAERDDIKNNKIYDNAFEWRFEFPEVLNDEGDFLGFDVVIGNPPYGVSVKGLERTYLLSNLSKVPDFEIYYWFIDKGHQLLKQEGIISYIIPNSILFNVFAQNYRLELFDKWELNEILDCTNFNIFEEATVRNIILQFIKNENKNTLSYKRTNDIKSFKELVSRTSVSVSKEIVEKSNQNWGLIFKLDKEVSTLVNKIKTLNTLAEQYDSTQGYIPYRKSDLLKVYDEAKAESIVKNREWHSNVKINTEYKEEIFGESLSKYNYKKTGSFVWYGKHLATHVDLKYFNQKRILIREITSTGIIACLVEEEFVNDPQIISIIPRSKKYSLEFLWAILNSKLATFYHFNSSPKATKGAFPKILVYDVNNFPLPNNIDKKVSKKIVTLVDQILSKKSIDPTTDTSHLEAQIDQLVYELYDLTEEEIKIIEAT
jgi:adenine-specific DNA-methyltransferase